MFISLLFEKKELLIKLAVNVTLEVPSDTVCALEERRTVGRPSVIFVIVRFNVATELSADPSFAITVKESVALALIELV